MKLRDRCRAMRPADFPVAIAVPGRFANIDMRQHVNNIAIASLFSEARAQFVRRVMAGLDPAERVQFLVGQQAVFYADETRYPGEIDVGCGLFEVGRSSLRFGQALFNDGRGTALAEAVLVATRQNRAVHVEGPLREAFIKTLLAGGVVPRQLMTLD